MTDLSDLVSTISWSRVCVCNTALSCVSVHFLCVRSFPVHNQSLLIPHTLIMRRVFRKMLYSEPNGGQKKKKKIVKSSDGYIEKYDFKGHPTVVVNDFEPEVFKQLITYTHTGAVVLQARTLLGLMNAADHYGLEDLKQACIRFMEQCITVDTVCSLLTSAEKYIQYKSTKILVQKMLEFVDVHAENILSLGAFTSLPQHVVRIVLSREELQTTQIKKFEAAYRWCLHSTEGEQANIKSTFEPFVDVIDFRLIPATVLMKNVKPARVIDDAIILTALAFQADPKSVDHISAAKPRHFRRVQSSGNPLNMESTETVVVRSKRGGSVPPPTAQSRLPRGEGHPSKLLLTRDRVISHSSSHLTSPPDSPSIISFHGSSVVSSECSSFEPEEYSSSGVSLSQPAVFDSPRNHSNYSPQVLDTIVTMSSTNAVEV